MSEQKEMLLLQINQIFESIEELKVKNGVLDEEIDDLKNDIEDLQDDNDDYEKKIDELNVKVDELHKILDLKSELDLLLIEINNNKKSPQEAIVLLEKIHNIIWDL